MNAKTPGKEDDQETRVRRIARTAGTAVSQTAPTVTRASRPCERRQPFSTLRNLRSVPWRPALFAFVLLFPLLGIAADAPAPFENEIRAFEQADAKSPPPKDAVLFLGSSSIRLWKTLEQDMPGMKVINRGFGGSQVADSVRYADRIVLPYRPKLIVFYAGDNDIASGKSPQRVMSDFREFVTKVHAALPEARILFVSLRPSVARWHLWGRQWLTNELMRQFADADPTVDYVDVVPTLLGPDGRPRADYLVADMLHLNPDGYRAWTAVIRPAVEKALK
jgi:lysophospholipase L1-like esterase